MTENCSCTRSKLIPSTCILFAVLRLEHLLRRGHDALRSTAGGSRTDVEEHNDISLESGDIGARALVCHDGRRRGILNLESRRCRALCRSTDPSINLDRDHVRHCPAAPCRSALAHLNNTVGGCAPENTSRLHRLTHIPKASPRKPKCWRRNGANPRTATRNCFLGMPARPCREDWQKPTYSCAVPTPSKSMIGLEGLQCWLRACHKVLGVQKKELDRRLEKARDTSAKRPWRRREPAGGRREVGLGTAVQYMMMESER